MAVFNLESLVLCGVSVLRDGQTVNPRLGTSAKAKRQTSGIPFSMRHPSPGCREEFDRPGDRPERVGYARVGVAAPGTGRSPSRAGVLSRRSPARTAGRAIPSGWSTAMGGPELAAAACLCLFEAGQVAFVGEGIPGRLAAIVTPRALPGSSHPAASGKSWEGAVKVLAGWKPAGRTPLASTRGKGVR